MTRVHGNWKERQLIALAQRSLIRKSNMTSGRKIQYFLCLGQVAKGQINRDWPYLARYEWLSNTQKGTLNEKRVPLFFPEYVLYEVRSSP